MKTAIRFGAFIALAFALLGQVPPKDVDGYDKIKWGMTIAEVRSAYDVTAPVQNRSLPLPPVKINNIEMRAYASTNEGTERISKVALLWGFNDAGFSGPYGFSTIKALLIQKYGPPINEETKIQYGDQTKTALWTFPSTTILLTFRPAYINLEYTETDKKALDKL
jgi:hypothetical protein